VEHGAISCSTRATGIRHLLRTGVAAGVAAGLAASLTAGLTTSLTGMGLSRGISRGWGRLRGLVCLLGWHMGQNLRGTLSGGLLQRGCHIVRCSGWGLRHLTWPLARLTIHIVGKQLTTTIHGLAGLSGNHHIGTNKLTFSTFQRIRIGQYRQRQTIGLT
jgi:hypothetical protein